MAKPFLKWAGGKRRVIPELMKYVPETFDTYYEPFLGGGAFYFHLEPARAQINDVNVELIATYWQIRDGLKELLIELHDMERFYSKMGEEYYYSVRESKPKLRVLQAAQFIFLNKTCFNGLYRVNKSSKFNVPFGKYANPLICDSKTLGECNYALQKTAISTFSFKDLGQRGAHFSWQPKKYDLVYIDPPYIPISQSANFTGYTKDGFGLDDQILVRDRALEWRGNGATVILSNSGSPLTEKLYERGFDLHPIQQRRNIAGSKESRAKIKEYIIIAK